jgi:hypothetical protein
MLEQITRLAMDAKRLRKAVNLVKPYTKNSYSPSVRLNGAGDGWVWVQAGFGALAQHPMPCDGPAIDVWVDPKALVGLLPKNGTVHLSVEEPEGQATFGRLRVEQDGNDGAVPLMNGDELRQALCFWPEVAGTLELVPIDVFAAGHVAGAAETSGTRPLLNTVFVGIDGAEITLAGTDSYHVIQSVGPMHEPIEDQRFNVPRAALDAHGAGKAATTALAVGRSALYPDYVCAESYDRDGLKLQTIDRYTDGTFPQYQSLIPDAADAFEILQVNTEQMLAAVKKCVDLKGKGSACILELCVDDDRHKARVSMEIQDGPSASADFTLDTPAAQEWRGGFNPLYLHNSIAAMPGETFELRLQSPLRPAVIESDGMLGLVMPIRINDMRSGDTTYFEKNDDR